MSTAFENYTKQDGSTVNYYNLIMPSGTSTTYWVASRCVTTDSDICIFVVHVVHSGRVSGYAMYFSFYADGADLDALALFPVVTLSSNLISGDATTGFSVK